MHEVDPPPPRPADSHLASGSTAESGAAPRRSRWWLGVITLLLLGAIVVLQRPDEPEPGAAAIAAEAPTVTAPRTSPYILLGKLLVAFRDLGPTIVQLVRAQLDTPSLGPASATDQFRILMLLVATDAADPANAPPPSAFGGGGLIAPGMNPTAPPRAPEQVLIDIEKGLAPGSPLREDVAMLRPLLELAAKPETTPAEIRAQVDLLTEDTRNGLLRRHGWFARVLFSTGEATAPVRQTAVTHATILLIGGLIVGGGVLLAFLAGVVLLVLALINLNSGRLRGTFAPPQPPRPPAAASARDRWVGGLWRETVAVFLLGFLALKLAIIAAERHLAPGEWLMWASLAGQWVLIVCIFWPMVRGLSFDEWKTRIGWHAPRGVWREIGAGLSAYIAGLPIYFGMAVVVVLLMFIIEAIRFAMGDKTPIPPPGNRITEIVADGGPMLLFMFFLLATIWAPIVEESIFRGALYRHFRGRWGLIGAGLLSAAAFAVMHGYMLIQLLMIVTLGMIFAVMREWRNSLVPCAAAHCLHNGFVMTLMLAVGWLMRG